MSIIAYTVQKTQKAAGLTYYVPPPIRASTSEASQLSVLLLNRLEQSHLLIN